jgi:amylosucrase
MGDELALLNDYSYLNRPDHALDSRWLHRPMMDWAAAAERDVAETPSARVFRGIRHILARRRVTPALHGAVPTEVLATGIPGIFAFARRAPAGTVLCLFNFTESWQNLAVGFAQAQGVTRMHDVLSDQPVQAHAGSIVLPPHARVWLT